MNLDVYKNHARFQELLSTAREHLQFTRTHLSPEPIPGSIPYLSFDPYIARRLNSFIPLRVLDIPGHEQTCNTIEALLDGWYELSLLSITKDISTWEVIVVRCFAHSPG